MNKKKISFYLFVAATILVIIGIIFITRKPITLSSEDKTIPSQTAPGRKIPFDKKTPQIQSSTSSSREIAEDRIINTLNAPEKDSGIIISGSVMLSDGSPAGNATIKLTMIDIGESFFDEKPLSSTTADINGKYSITAPLTLFILVKASYPGYANMVTITGTFTTRGESTSPKETKEVIRNFVLPPASYIKGCVVDENNNPIQGVSVSSSSGRAKIMETFSYENAVTDNQGGFEIQNIPSGKTTLTAAILDRMPQVKEINAPAENIIFQLLPANGSISGRVFHKITGESITSATVCLGFINQRQITNIPQKKSITEQTGFYSFDHLAPGQYYISAQKDDLLLFVTEDIPDNRLKLKENEKKEGFNLYLYEGHTVKGRVTDKNTGTPVEGARVSSISEFLSSQKDITGPDGFYMLKGLSGTVVILTAQKENYILNGELDQSPFIQVNLDPEILETSKDMQMIPGLFISGRVETEQGSPPENAKVYLYQRNDMTTLDRALPVDSNGKFKLMAQPFTICYVKARAEGYPIAFSDPIDVQNKPIDNIIVVLKKASVISGFVRDKDNKPIQGAEIQAQFSLNMGKRTHYEDLNAFVIISDSKGAFKAENLPPGNIVLTAEKKGYTNSQQERISITPGEKKTNVILRLAESTFLAGKITDPDGNPLKNIYISVGANVPGVRSYGSDWTNEEGRYRIEGLFNTPHKLTLRHAEYESEQHKDVEVGREDADFVFNMKLKKQITLIGIVKDWKTGNPIENFNVSSRGLKPKKDPDVPGKFVIQNLTPGRGCMVKIESEGYAPLDTGYFSLPENENPVEKTFKLGPGGIVKGRVINKETQESLEGVSVLLFLTNKEYEISRISPAENLITRNDGLFRFESIPPGDIFIRFIPESPLCPQLKSITVKHGVITDMGDVEMTGGGIIRGKLVQMPDEIPIPGKVILLQESGSDFPKNFKTITDDKGCFEFQDVKNGRYTILANEYAIRESAEIKEDETNEYTLRVGTGALKGIVMKKGEPQNVSVSLHPVHLIHGKRARTNEKGEFEITGLVPGKWKISFSMNGYSRNVEELIDITPDNVTEKTFELPSGRIVGKVVNAKDEPVEDALISAQMMQIANAEDAYYPKTWNAVSNKEGAFEIADMLPTSYAVSANKNNMGLALVENAAVPENADSAPVLLRLEEGKGGTLISVALNLKNAQPVPNAWCHLSTSEGVRFDHGLKRGMDGIITITNIPSGTYIVQVSCFGFSVHEHIVDIKDGETCELEDVMYEAGTLRWTVLDADGNPVEDAQCRIEPLDVNTIEKAREGTTDNQGLWIQSGLYPGSYRMTAKLSDGREATDTMEIQAHQHIQKTAVVK